MMKTLANDPTSLYRVEPQVLGFVKVKATEVQAVVIVAAPYGAGSTASVKCNAQVRP